MGKENKKLKGNRFLKYQIKMYGFTRAICEIMIINVYFLLMSQFER